MLKNIAITFGGKHWKSLFASIKKKTIFLQISHNCCFMPFFACVRTLHQRLVQKSVFSISPTFFSFLLPTLFGALDWTVGSIFSRFMAQLFFLFLPLKRGRNSKPRHGRPIDLFFSYQPYLCLAFLLHHRIGISSTSTVLSYCTVYGSVRSKVETTVSLDNFHVYCYVFKENGWNYNSSIYNSNL